MCFVHCVDNFFTRDLSTTESNCLDKCVLKFSNVNQRIMSAYVRDQAIINERRMKEMEDQARANEASLAASAAAATPASTAETIPIDQPLTTTIETLNESTTTPNSLGLDSSTSSKASILKLASSEDTSQNLVT